MNKLVQLVWVLSSVAVFSLAFAGTQNESNSSTACSYTSPDDELVINIERGKGIVTFGITMPNLTSYHHLIIEKSLERPDNFGQCKYITCSEKKVVNGKITETDNYPYPANKGVYYRVKTVNKDGSERSYAAVFLPPLEGPTAINVPTNNTETKTTTNSK